MITTVGLVRISHRYIKEIEKIFFPVTRQVVFNIFLTNSGTISEKNEIFGKAIYKEQIN